MENATKKLIFLLNILIYFYFSSGYFVWSQQNYQRTESKILKNDFLGDSSSIITNGLPLKGTRSLKINTTEGTWLSLDVHPNGKKLVFSLLGDLYELPLTGGDGIRLTDGISLDAQPKYSPDGKSIAFISDRDGAENVHLYDLESQEVTQQLTHSSDEYYQGLSWSPDGQYLVVSKGVGTPKLHLYHKDGGSGALLTPKAGNLKSIEPTFAKNGDIWFSQRKGMWDYNALLPQYHIATYSRSTGEIKKVISRYGSAFAPTLSPDGKWVVYGTREDAETGLIIRELATGEERWFAYPVQHDDQESLASMGVIPAMSFTPDSKNLLTSYGGKIYSIGVDNNEASEIPFRIKSEIMIGPKLEFKYPIEDDSDFNVSQIRDLTFSPDKSKIAFTAMNRLYTMDYPNGVPRRLTNLEVTEAQPTWSPDGESIAFVTWDDRGGAIYVVGAKRKKPAKRLTQGNNFFYQEPVWSPDGNKIVFFKGFSYGYRQTSHDSKAAKQSLSWIAKEGGDSHFISEPIGTNPHFSEDPERIYLFDPQKGLISINWKGENIKEHLNLTGFDSYAYDNTNGGQFTFSREAASPSDIVKSPTENFALVRFANEVYLVTIPQTGGETPIISVKEVSASAFPTWKLTTIGAEFPSWSSDGQSIYWSLGSSYFSYDLSQRNQEDYEPLESDISIRVKNDIPKQELLLSGARIITMEGDQIFEEGDLLIKDNRIKEVGPVGTLNTSNNTNIISLSGKTIVPGFFDLHAHMPVARNIQHMQPASYASQLAYGITTTRDPQPSTTDILTYGDLVKNGEILGPRIYSTGPGLAFWAYNIKSLDHARNVMKQYSQYYDTKTIKMYAVGNRQQRQWIIMAAKEQRIMPTTEGNLDMKLNLTEVLDGYPGHEHAYPVFPWYNDFISFVAQSEIAFSSAFLLGYGGPSAENYFYSTEDVINDKKLNHFSPKIYLDKRTRRRKAWFAKDEYVFERQAKIVAQVMDSGGLPAIGGHGQLQGLGYHWELWAHKTDEINNLQILQLATINGAKAIGLDRDLGSIKPGKLADLIVMNKNPIDDIRNTNTIHYVMKNGRLYNGDSLDEVAPQEKERPYFSWKEVGPQDIPGVAN